MSKNSNLDFEWITRLKNEKNLDTIRKLVSMQATMMLNSEQYQSGLIDKELYAENVSVAQEALNKILFDTKEDLDYLAKVEKEQYEALKERKGS